MNTRASSGHNLLLDSLTPATRQAIASTVRERRLQQGAVIVEAGRPSLSVYFPLSGVFSVITRGMEAQAVETVAIGRESFIAFPLFEDTNSTTSVVVQSAATVLEMPRVSFLRHMAREDFCMAIFRHQERIFQIACQSTVCQAYHNAEQRLARWLLILHDRSDSDELHLTQDFLASMMGVQRPTVTIAARILQAAELITYRYGKIHVRDRLGLEAVCCECYAVTDRPTFGFPVEEKA